MFRLRVETVTPTHPLDAPQKTLPTMYVSWLRTLKTRLGRPPTMEEWAVELAALDGAEEIERELKVMREARERMISCNLRLVLHIARKSFYSGGSGGLKVCSMCTGSRFCSWIGGGYSCHAWP